MENFKLGQELKVKNKKTGEKINVVIKNIINGKPIFEKIEDKKFVVYVDTREDINFVKKIYLSKKLKLEKKNLDIGDILIDENICIERKKQEDFINSILDKRLFKQAYNLIMKYRKPILLIEGNRDLFSIRNIHKNIIYSTLCSLAIDYKIPIIFTKSSEESVELIENLISRLENKNRKLQFKKQFSSGLNEELENFISQIPRINKINSISLLKNFGTIKNIINSSEGDFLKISGIGEKRAKNIYGFFNREYKK